MDYNKKSRSELIVICKEKKLKAYSSKTKSELLALLDGTAPVKNKSPLRYPGGKSRAVAILERYANTQYPNRKTLLSPFFGGGSFELFMKSQGYRIVGNDLFKPLATFWKVVQRDPQRLAQTIQTKMPVTKEAFQNLRTHILSMEDEMEQAAAYFIINRCSFSGATLCGGFSADAASNRLTASSLKTLEACDLQDIVFSNKDCLAFLTEHPETEDTFVYADPPYYIETYIYGKDGDMHEGFHHEAFATAIQKRRDWIISYNDCPFIRNLYRGCRFFTESWAYGMNATKKSSEVLILPAAI